MKKYFSSFFAFILAIFMGAYTRPIKPFSYEIFRFQGDPTSEASVENIANWTQVPSQLCPSNVDDKACEILVNEIYCHDNGEGEQVLNNQAYINNEETPDSEQLMTINAADGCTFSTFYYVTSAGTTGTPYNMDYCIGR